MTNGMDGRHVEDVEAHGCDFGDAIGDVDQRAMGSCGPRGAWKEFVPGGEASTLAINPEREFGRVPGGEGEIRVFGYEGDEVRCNGGFVVGKVIVGEGKELVGRREQL